jgi:hypothetical protein
VADDASICSCSKQVAVHASNLTVHEMKEILQNTEEEINNMEHAVGHIQVVIMSQKFTEMKLMRLRL